jgi:DTW domain-containing protein YfiP
LFYYPTKIKNLGRKNAKIDTNGQLCLNPSMTKQLSTMKIRCQGCELPMRFCLCQKITALPLKTSVSIVMHHREEHLASNTGRLAKLAISQCQIFLRGRPDQTLDMAQVLERPGKALFLYPCEDAVDIAEFKPEDGPYHLIVPDGSWRQAKRVKKREPLLDQVTSIKISPKTTARYLLRKAPRPDFLSTYEAIACCLQHFEGPFVYQQLMDYFDLLINPQFEIRHPGKKREAIERLRPV